MGAVPLFFLDYVALGRMDAVRVEQIVSGFARGCANAAFVGALQVSCETHDRPEHVLEEGDLLQLPLPVEFERAPEGVPRFAGIAVFSGFFPPLELPFFTVQREKHCRCSAQNVRRPNADCVIQPGD